MTLTLPWLAWLLLGALALVGLLVSVIAALIVWAVCTDETIYDVHDVRRVKG